MKKFFVGLVIALSLTGCDQRDALIAESMANVKAAAVAGMKGAPAELVFPAIMREADAVAAQLGYRIDVNKGVNND